jgi:hypothetical protein
MHTPIGTPDVEAMVKSGVLSNLRMATMFLFKCYDKLLSSSLSTAVSMSIMLLGDDTQDSHACAPRRKNATC